MIRYLDTSAALKLVIDEPESEALASFLDGAADDVRLVSSMLLFTELHCAARRRAELDPASVNAVLDAVDLVRISNEELIQAGTSGWGLRSADAIHLAVALRVEASELVAYDLELCDAALRVGLRVMRPPAL